MTAIKNTYQKSEFICLEIEEINEVFKKIHFKRDTNKLHKDLQRNTAI